MEKPYSNFERIIEQLAQVPEVVNTGKIKIVFGVDKENNFSCGILDEHNDLLVQGASYNLETAALEALIKIAPSLVGDYRENPMRRFDSEVAGLLFPENPELSIRSLVMENRGGLKPWNVTAYAESGKKKLTNSLGKTLSDCVDGLAKGYLGEIEKGIPSAPKTPNMKITVKGSGTFTPSTEGREL
jgi:hypothetical protein